MEAEERPLEEQSDAELLRAFVAVRGADAKLNAILKGRALARLAGVHGFPWKGGISEEKVDAAHVLVDLAGTGRMVVRVPIYWMNNGQIEKLGANLRALPDVEVTIDGTPGSPMHAFIVNIDPGKPSTPYPVAVETVQQKVAAVMQD